jgi:hypothetical protein
MCYTAMKSKHNDARRAKFYKYLKSSYFNYKNLWARIYPHLECMYLETAGFSL